MPVKVKLVFLIVKKKLGKTHNEVHVNELTCGCCCKSVLKLINLCRKRTVGNGAVEKGLLLRRLLWRLGHFVTGLPLRSITEWSFQGLLRFMENGKVCENYGAGVRPSLQYIVLNNVRSDPKYMPLHCK